ncbi:DoxX family protein [Rhizobium wenxiniae]|uniref:DoxX family protein n=1 Tax=Rhizobium wenxiniae TaxID=1737357 RepID=UPI001C6DED54|nr:DoxX family protein [Rhizobium wenxiniae]MBW9089787.1 DoxX family protein [Rhizobium wenxiniae]
MLYTILTSLVVVGFAGAGLFNAIGLAGQRQNFVRWGFPPWWHLLTGLLELATAVLVALPAFQTTGLIVGAIIMAAAAATVVNCREFSHLCPIGVFVIGLVGVGLTY